MHSRRDTHPIALEVQALYSVAALARAANVGTELLRRVLRANGIVFVRGGRALLVPLSEIRDRIPLLWESLKAAEQARQSAGKAERAPRRRP
jgi:hypothetical protein